MLRSRLLPLLVLLTLLGMQLVFPIRAFAHPKIVRTEPADGAVLSRAPRMALIVFDEPIEAAFSTIGVFGADGVAVPGGSGGRDSDDPAMLRTALPALGPGIYTVIWQVVGSDGHVIKGYFVFTVEGPTAPDVPPVASAQTPTPVARMLTPEATRPQIESEIPVLPALLRALLLLSALGLVGGWLVVALIIGPGLPPGSVLVRRSIWAQWERSAAILLIIHALAGAAFLLVHTQAAAGRADSGSIWIVLSGTRLGMALGMRISLALITCACLALTHFRGDVQPALGLPTSLVLLVVFALTGHAAAQPQPLWPILADAAHLLSTAIWVGGLLGLAVLLGPLLEMLTDQQRPSVLAAIIARFSTLALVCVAVLSVSGVYSALRYITGIGDLLNSSYGRALTAKLILFGGMLLVGAYHLVITRPQFTAWARRATAQVTQQPRLIRFLTTLYGEVVLAVLIIGAAGVMTSVAPPARERPRPEPSPAIPTPAMVRTPTAWPTRTPNPSRPFAETRTAGDLLVELRVQPASLGKNRLEVTVRDQTGTPIEVQRVMLTLDMPAMDMGITRSPAEPMGRGRYAATDTWVSMVGEWRVLVAVRRLDAPDIEATFLVPIGG